MKLTLQSLLEEGSARLSKAGVKEALLDSRYLLFEAFNMDWTHFLLDRNEEISDLEKVEMYRALLEKREKRVPLQQIFGKCHFMGLEFYINKNVLIPRQDTEILAELILKDYKGSNAEILDMCTGSGCIAVSLACLGGFEGILAVDISPKALEVARENVRKLVGEGRIELAESDLFASFAKNRKFDVIVSNPPYIPTKEIEGLEPEVRDFEPRLALDGKEDGLHFYKKLILEGRRYLKPQGAVYFEIGFDQGEGVSGLLKKAGFEEVRIEKDRAGLNRVAVGRWNSFGGNYV